MNMTPKKPTDTQQFHGTEPGTFVQIDKFPQDVIVESTPNDSNKDDKPDGTVYVEPKVSYELNY